MSRSRLAPGFLLLLVAAREGRGCLVVACSLGGIGSLWCVLVRLARVYPAIVGVVTEASELAGAGATVDGGWCA